MTTLAMIFGMPFPALGLGEGGERRASLGRRRIGRRDHFVLLTLVVVPVAYTVLDDFSMGDLQKMAARPKGRHPLWKGTHCALERSRDIPAEVDRALMRLRRPRKPLYSF